MGFWSLIGLPLFFLVGLAKRKSAMLIDKTSRPRGRRDSSTRPERIREQGEKICSSLARSLFLSLSLSPDSSALSFSVASSWKRH